MKIRNIAAVVTIAAASATVGAVGASASSTPVYSTSSKVVYVYSPKCLHTHTRTVRYRSYSSKANGGQGGYVLLVKPSVTVSDSSRCHS